MTNCNSTNGRCPTLNRKSFMAELRSLLAFLDAAERDRVLNRYERMFDEAGPEGETTVVRCFGSPGPADRAGIPRSGSERRNAVCRRRSRRAGGDRSAGRDRDHRGRIHRCTYTRRRERAGSGRAAAGRSPRRAYRRAAGRAAGARAGRRNRRGAGACRAAGDRS